METNNSKWEHPDSRMPTEEERKVLCKMLQNALLEIRMLGWSDKAEQAADLADAFHNLPVYLSSDSFSFEFFRNFLQAYQIKYQKDAFFNYVNMLDELLKNK
jgi:hypothetical protein